MRDFRISFLLLGRGIFQKKFSLRCHLQGNHFKNAHEINFLENFIFPPYKMIEAPKKCSIIFLKNRFFIVNVMCNTVPHVTMIKPSLIFNNPLQ